MENNHIDAILGEPEIIEVEDSSPEPIETPAPTEPPVEQEAPEQEERKKYVPHAALHEAREKTKETRAELERERQARIELEQKFTAMMQKMQQPEESNYFDKTESELTQVKEVVQKIVGSQQAAAQETAFLTRYKASVDAYTQDQPDFSEAYNHLTQSRKAEYIALGYSQEEATQAIRNDEKMIVSRAYQIEKNPGEVLYALAQQRGYAPKSTQVKTVADIDKSVKASKSLGASGSSAVSDFSLEEVSDLPDGEFNKLFEQFEKNAKKLERR